MDQKDILEDYYEALNRAIENKSNYIHLENNTIRESIEDEELE